MADKDGTANEPDRTVSKADYDALQSKLDDAVARLEDIVKKQSGSDRKVAELTKALEAKTQQVADAERTAEEKMAERIARLEEENREAKRVAERERFLNSGYKEAQSRGLPTSLVDNYGGDVANLGAYLDEIRGALTAQKNSEKAKELGAAYKPGSGNEPDAIPDISKLSFADLVALEEKGELNARIAK